MVILSFCYKTHVLEEHGDTSSQTSPQVLSDMNILCVYFSRLLDNEEFLIFSDIPTQVSSGDCLSSFPSPSEWQFQTHVSWFGHPLAFRFIRWNVLFISWRKCLYVLISVWDRQTLTVTCYNCRQGGTGFSIKRQACLLTVLSEMELAYQQFTSGLWLFRRWSKFYFSHRIWCSNLLDKSIWLFIPRKMFVGFSSKYCHCPDYVQMCL